MRDYMDNIEISERLDGVIHNSISELKIEKRKRSMRNAAFVGVFVLSMVGIGTGFCCTHTAYASKLPIIGAIFAKMENNTSYKGDLEKDAQYLVDEEDIIKLENEEKIDNPYVQESNGLTVSITEVNYDKAGIYLGMSIQSDEAFPEGFNLKKVMEDYVLSYNRFGVMGNCTLKDTSGNVLGTAILEDVEGDFTDEKTFVGVAQIDLSYLQYYPTPEEIEEAGIDIDNYIDDEEYLSAVKEAFPKAGEKIQLPDQFICDLSIEGFFNEIYETGKEDDNIVNYEGEWSYCLDVATDPANYDTVDVNKFDENGYGISAVHKSKYTITVDTKLPAMGIDYFVVVCDANGDKLENQGSIAETYSIVGRDVSKISIFVCDYDTYMNELKGYYYSEDYENVKCEKSFAQYLEEYAVYSTTVEWK